jgi:DNA sulfur modification protein DndD
MLVAGDDGRWMPPMQQPEDIIGQILPETLHQYFFFDGERIDHIIRYEKKTEIAEATKELLGIKVLERSVEHLKKAKRTLEEELKAIGDTETQQLLQAQYQLEEERDRLHQRQQEILQEIARQEEFKKTISDHLLELNSAEKLQQFKNQLEAQEKSTQQNLVQAKKALKQAISTRGYTVFLSDITAQFHTLVDDLREKGELPAGIKQQFVNELLERKRCICGTELTEESHAHQMVEAWKERAGIAEVEEAAIRMESQVGELEKQAPEFWQEVDSQQAQINHLRTELGRIENELDEVKNKLRAYPDEDIQKLQKQLDAAEETIRESSLEQGRNQQEIERLTAEFEEKGKQIAKHKMKEEKQLLARRRIQATQESIERFIEVKARIEQQFRASLEKRVQEIFASISFTPYLPKLSEKYELTLVENTAEKEASVAASTGENQILSLSFIGGIIDRVREWSQRNTLMGPDSSTFPVVMDSPFGSLDEIYRRQVASSIPKLANQLVVLATKTQWRGEVAQEMADYLGREYVLVYYSPKPDCEEDAIEINGIRYPLVQRSANEFEYTEIIEVKRDG